ncbi:MAG: dihydrofolate reductase [Clostridia bacterium]
MISIIAAVGKNNELGLNNNLIWNLPSDLKFFKNQTLNSTVVMGKNTYLSLPFALPNRKNIVLSHINTFKNSDKCIVYNSKEELMNYINNTKEDIYIIGGANIYNMFIDIVNNIILTEIDAESTADVYFPKFNKLNFTKVILGNNSDNGINYTHVKYIKKI